MILMKLDTWLHGRAPWTDSFTQVGPVETKKGYWKAIQLFCPVRARIIFILKWYNRHSATGSLFPFPTFMGRFKIPTTATHD